MEFLTSQQIEVILLWAKIYKEATLTFRTDEEEIVQILKKSLEE